MSLNRKHFINWQQLITYIRNNTGYDTEIIENVLDAETMFLLNIDVNKLNNDEDKKAV